MICSRISRRKARAFTLVELLVVIGIIALLISILLPSLAKARRAANTVKCSANIRSILQGMQIYAAQNNGAIPGSPWTTSRFLYKNYDPATGAQNSAYGPNICPTLIQVSDWVTPIAKIMGIKFEEGQLASQRAARFEFLRDHPSFLCPENEFLAPPFSGSVPQYKTGRMFSYCAAQGFLVAYNPNTGTGGSLAGTVLGINPFYNPSPGYAIKVSKVGDASRKIFVADGARFATAGVSPDHDLSYMGTQGGVFADQGAGSRFSRAWDRGNAPGNTPESAGSVDARIYAYRHGSTRVFGAADTFRFNAGFFDGHVETLGDLQGSNPNLWHPKNARLTVDTTEMQADVVKFFFQGQSYTGSNLWTVPY